MNRLDRSNFLSLEEVASEFQNGIGKGKSFYGSGVKVANIGDLYESHTFSPIKFSLLECSQKEIEKYCLKRGDLLFVRSSLKREGVAYCSSYESDETCLFSSFMIRISSDQSKVSAPFLAYQLRSPRGRAELLARSNTSTITNISQNGLKSVQVWLPPLETQKRIVALLDRAQALIDSRKEQIALMDQLVQSLFYDMFGDPVMNPMGWEVGRIHDLAIKTQYGTGTKAHESKGLFPVLRMNNITYLGGWNLKKLKYVDLDEKEQAKYLVYKDEILFNRTNSKELVGKTAVYNQDKPMAFAGYLVKLIVNDRSVPQYISAYLNSKHGKAVLLNMAKSIVGMANINAEELKKIKILIPPLNLQNLFAQRVQKIEAQKAAMTVSLRELENNFNSLMQRAFKGEGC